MLPHGNYKKGIYWLQFVFQTLSYMFHLDVCILCNNLKRLVFLFFFTLILQKKELKLRKVK